MATRMSEEPAQERPGEELKIGVCLSGGGFRASFYALGIFRYLAEAKLLDRVVAVAAVSGGSIAAAAVADRWDEFQAAGGMPASSIARWDGKSWSALGSGVSGSYYASGAYGLASDGAG